MKTKYLLPALAVAMFYAYKASGAVFYVDVNSTNPLAPYTDWSTAAKNIQDAVQAAGAASGTVLVTNGVYETGGTSLGGTGSNRVSIISGNLTVKSVNGPAVTVIKGYPAPSGSSGQMRGAYVASGATLSGFTVSAGASLSHGGGVYGQSYTAVVTNCILTGNSAAARGGGVYSGTLNNCTLSANSAVEAGGGCYQSQLQNCLVISNSTSGVGGGGYDGMYTNCTLVGNTAGVAGGAVAINAVLYNCIAYYNSAPTSPNLYDCKANYCCTTPLPFGGGNITNAPAFVDLPGGNYRLQVGSPCVDAGNNSLAPAFADPDGAARIVGAAVDIGAYENQNTNLVHYVSLTSTNPVPPYTTWLTAATNIQDAVSVAQPGEVVAADAGRYQNGGVVIYGAETNRVALTNGVTLLGVYGPASTLIVGGTQMRCVYVGSNCLLSGFTITNGHARANLTGNFNITNEASGGGTWCEPGGCVANCLVISNYAYSAAGYGGGIYGGVVSNCTLVGNVAAFGGGAGGGSQLWSCTVANNLAFGGGGGAFQAGLYNCNLSNNAGVYNSVFGPGGGGACQCLAQNCRIVGNSDTSIGRGGGTSQGTNLNCTIAGNTTYYGGGTYQSTNFNCLILSNTVAYNGGGAYQGLLYNCVLAGNAATGAVAFAASGGGAYDSTLVNCTVVSNRAVDTGGLYHGLAYNSILYFNTGSGSSSNWGVGGPIYYCCVAPLLGPGTGNFTTAPSFVDAAGGDFRLKCGSSCVDRGSTNGSIFGTAADLRGVPRPLDGDGDSLASPDVGAYEFAPDTDHGPAIRAAFSFGAFSTSYAAPFVAQIGGCPDYYWWDFGDGSTMTNQSNVSHAWSAPGTFTVRLSAHYSSLGTALSATTNVQVVQQQIYYVNAANGQPKSPYTNWATAATGIQAAIGAGTTPGRLVLVTNGLYETTGVPLLGTAALTNVVLVQSVNGPEVTTIRPDGGRCAYVGNNALLSGFTLTRGDALNGGGVWCEPEGVVSSCVVANNTANMNGGGAFGGTFHNCVFSNNVVSTGTAVGNGGAAYGSSLYNCTVISNRVSTSFPGGKGGGTFGGTLSNCTLIGNMVSKGDANGSGGGAYGGTLYNCLLNANSGSGYGGGAAADTLWNCTLSTNWANNGAGAYASTLYNCLLKANETPGSGGGANGCFAYNCTVAGNTALTGGGIHNSTLSNCIVYFNTATDNSSSSNWSGAGQFWSSCTAPRPSGAGNVVADPLFANPAAGDFHLLLGSPCIDSGRDLSGLLTKDLEGTSRPLDGNGDGLAKFDMGCYEFDLMAMVGSDWLSAHGLDPNDPLVFATDHDGDGLTTLQEWIAGTDPTNAASALRMEAPVVAQPGLLLRWNSGTQQVYSVERATSLSNPASFLLLKDNIQGRAGATTFFDDSAPQAGAAFYRVTGTSNTLAAVVLQQPVFARGGVALAWASVTNRSYYVERSTSAAPPAFTVLRTQLPGREARTTFVDMTATNATFYLYRIGVHTPGSQ